MNTFSKRATSQGKYGFSSSGTVVNNSFADANKLKIAANT